MHSYQILKVQHPFGFQSARREYSSLKLAAVKLECADGAILAASLISNSQILSVGQELGPEYDFAALNGIDSNTGKTFSHEWETGNE